MQKSVAFIRNFWIVRDRPGVIVKKFAVSARGENQTRPQPMGKLVDDEASLGDLLVSAGLSRSPKTDEFVMVTMEQLETLGIDPEYLD